MQDELWIDLEDTTPLSLLMQNAVLRIPATSYSDLAGKPSINNVELDGDLSSSDLGLQSELTFDSTPTENSLHPVTSGGVYTAIQASSGGSDKVSKTGDTMTGDLNITRELYPSLFLLPSRNGTTNRSVFEGSYVGATSMASWDDNTGENRRMLEVRNKSYAADLDNAALLRVCDSGTWANYRVFHSGMESAIPIANGGTGQTTAAAARNALGLGNTTGALPIANGGTGQSTAAGARDALGLGNTTGALPIANGGTGQTTAAAARNALGLGNTTGALPIANGGTGQTTVAAARNALGLGNTAGALPIANGGTGATTASAARTNLGLNFSLSGTTLTITVS